MKELVVISGKGGTGKTSITASLAAMAGKAMLADCDVDAADLHLLLRPEIKARHEFICGYEAVVDSEACIGCGACCQICRFDAIKLIGRAARIDPYSCEGCGVCTKFCPVEAIDFCERDCGEWYESQTRYGDMVHAKLAPAAENSGKLVAQVRKAARENAEKQGCNLILVDGPPGIGCPVIASVGGASAVLVVTEPTVSGEHDLERVLKLTRHFEIPTLICVNKWDLNPEATEIIERKATKAGAKIVGRIPYDKIFTEAMVAGNLVINYAGTEASKSIFNMWKNICRTI